MAKLTDKEKVLEYLLSQNIKPNGNLYLGTDSYSKIKNISRSDFIRQLISLQYDDLISTYFHGREDGSAACTLTLKPPAYEYFQNKNKEVKQRILKSITLTLREIILLALGAIFGGVATYIVTSITQF